MPRFVWIATIAAVVACAKTEPRVENQPSPAPHRPHVEVVRGFIPDSARNEALAAAAANAAVTKSEPAEVLDLQDDSSSDAIALITTNIDTTITLGGWLKSHPMDRIGMVAPAGDGVEDEFCRAAVVRTHVGSTKLVRSALFYIPLAPKGESLPNDTTKLAEDLCQLGAMVLASEEMSFASAQAIRDSLANAISKRLGSPSDKVPELAGGVRGSTGPKMWRIGITTVVTTASETGEKAGGAQGDSTGKTFVVAYTPGSGPADFDGWEARYEERHGKNATDRRLEYADVDSALAWAQMPAVSTDLKTVISYLMTRDENKPREVKPPAIDAALLRAMKAIHQSAPALPPARRAAALLAGDVVFGATYGLPSGDSGAAVTNALPAIGITLADPGGGYDRYYPHTWLWESYRADSTGRAGRAAFVRLLGLRWSENQSCDGDEYKPIIEHGEAALARGDNNPLIHHYVGSAYKTIYDLAHYENSEVGNPAAFQSQAEPARLKAIEHFRAALQSLPDRATRREAWLKAMRLLLRRSGEQPEYVCFED